MRNTTIIISIIFILLLPGCDQFMDEVMSYSDYDGPVFDIIDQDTTNVYKHHGKDSFYPLVKGYTWVYQTDSDFGIFYQDRLRSGVVRVEEAKVVEDNKYNGDMFVRIDNKSGFFGYIRYSNYHSYKNRKSLFILSQIRILANNLPHDRIDDDYEQLLGTTEAKSSYEREGYPHYTTITYGDSLQDIVTPEGREYHDCIKITADMDTPEGWIEKTYQKKLVTYLAKGIGHVYTRVEYSTGEVETIYVTEYTRFGETVKFLDDDEVSPLKTEKVYMEGEQIILPHISRNGFDLTGWSDGTDVHTPGDTFVMPDDDVDFTAVWTVAEQ